MGRLRPHRSRAAACLAVAGFAAAGCGGLLGVDHDWTLVDSDASTAIDDAETDRVTTGDAGGPVADAASPDGTAADEDARADACSAGSLSCNGTQPQICTGSGTWQNVGAPCTASDPVCLGGACVVCEPGANGCVGQQPAHCDSTGSWREAGVACVNQACVGGGCVGSCSPGALTCVNGYWLVCSGNGTWQLVGTTC